MSNAGPLPDPRLNFVAQTEAVVKAVYFNMPGGAQILLVNQTTGVVADGGTVLDSGGSGNVSVDITSAPSGDYYLVGEDAAGEELTQTVTFSINHE